MARDKPMTKSANNLIPDKHTQLLLAELVKILFYQPVYLILAGHALAVVITLAFLWGVVPAHLLIAWSALMLTLTVIWFVMVAIYRNGKQSDESAKIWLHLFPIAGLLTGLGWGVSAFLPEIMRDYSVTVFLSIMVLGVTAAGLAVFAPYLRSYVAFAVFALTPFSINFFLHGGKLHLTLGIMFILYLSVILISALNMKRAVRESISLRFGNLELVDNLVEQNHQAELARADAEQANQAKSKFLAAASHDLRQPLHALGLFVDALESRIHYPEVKSIVDNIRISTDAMSDLLNGLLDISKLDAGVYQPTITDVAIQPLMRRIHTDFNDLADAKSLRLRVVDCRYLVKSDAGMLERILRNLVSNAIRYTVSGRVLLGCRRRGDRVSIEIHDTGIGIAADQQAEIFEEFYQVENPERDRSKGVGLGLAIVKRLSELLDCDVSLDSTPGRGTMFSVSVPYVSNAGSTDSHLQPFTDDLHGTRVLVIDDDAAIRTGMRQVLEQWGCRVLDAESDATIAGLLESQGEIDIILSDYRLQEGKSGIDVVHYVQDLYDKPIPAIILTGDTDPQRLRDAKDSGFKLLHKPVAVAKLRSLMSYLLAESQQS